MEKAKRRLREGRRGRGRAGESSSMDGSDGCTDAWRCCKSPEKPPEVLPRARRFKANARARRAKKGADHINRNRSRTCTHKEPAGEHQAAF